MGSETALKLLTKLFNMPQSITFFGLSESDSHIPNQWAQMAQNTTRKAFLHIARRKA